MAKDDEGARRLEPRLSDRVVRVVRRLVSRGRKGLDLAARTSRSQLELRQLHRDLDHFWVRLGKTAHRLVEAGEIDHPALRKAIQRIEELEAQIDAARGPSRERDRSDG